MEECLLQSIVDDYFPIGSRERGFTLELASASVELVKEGAFATLRLVVWEVADDSFRVLDMREQRTRVLASAQLDDAVAVREWLDEVVARAEELTRDDVALMMPDEFMEPAEPETVAAWRAPIATPLSRDSILLCPRAGVSDAADSKIGGDVLWPEGQDWPLCPEHETPMLPVVQLRRDDVPFVPFPEGADLFQLVWCPQAHTRVSPKWAPAHRVFWRDSGRDNLVPRASSITKMYVDMPGYVPVPCVLEFRWCPGDREDGEVARGTKVGGDPRWIQNPDVPVCECGEEMSHLLTISDWEGNTSYCRRVAAYGDDDGLNEAWKSPTGLQLGDIASLYYFVCCFCDHRPVKGSFQTH